MKRPNILQLKPRSRAAIDRRKVERAAEALSRSLDDPTMAELKRDPNNRPTKRLHLNPREPVTFHMSPKMFKFLTEWTKSVNISRSWYILRCVIEGLIRDANLSAVHLTNLDRDVPETRDRPEEPEKRKARHAEATAFIREKKAKRETEEDPNGWLRRL